MNAQQNVTTPTSTLLRFPARSAPFQKVTDSRGKPILCLWKRNTRFYAQIRIAGKRSSIKVPLTSTAGVPVATVPEARAALEELLRKRRSASVPQTGTPTFGDYAETYLQWLRSTGAKSPLTISKETGSLRLWARTLGSVRLAHLRRNHINQFIAHRKATGVSNRTINLDVIALKNCLKHARDNGHINALPTDGWRPLRHQSPRRPLWTEEQIEGVCQKPADLGAPGETLADYLRFLAYSGSRRNEALALQWSDIDWDRRLVALNKTKFNRPRVIDMNPRLEALLKDMLSRRKADHLLFGAFGPGERAVSTLQRILESARQAASLPDFCLHDMRHYFISKAVMAGIDYMTIARWVGHRDAGILIGRVYGHLSDEHAKRMAEKLAF